MNFLVIQEMNFWKKSKQGNMVKKGVWKL